jgi:chromate transporter
LKKNSKLYLKLFMSTFYLSAFTFGGGYVIVPLMKKKFVDHYHWIDEKEMLDLIAISQSSPGAIAVNASILIGYRLAGVLGSLVTILGTVLPPLIILSVISLFYAAFRDNVIVNALLKGMQAGVAAVIIDVVITMGNGIVKEKNTLSIIVMITAFIAAFIFKVNVIFIILACGLLGFSLTYFKGKFRKDRP